jgi:hemerythrin-like metal-binding protein
MFIEWNETLEIGIKEIDNEHKSIISKFEELYQKMREGKGHQFYRELITFLDDYVNTHLAHEETYQKEIDYINYEAHKEKHDEFRHILEELKEEELDDITNAELIRINLLMKDWLVHHILEEDMKIGQFVKGNLS